jgi:hypothetical protein
MSAAKTVSTALNMMRGMKGNIKRSMTTFGGGGV